MNSVLRAAAGVAVAPGMMSGLNDKLCGLSGVTRVQGTLGATMLPPADME
jgi:hypothetical protein